MRLSKTIFVVMLLVLSIFAVKVSAETKLTGTDELNDVLYGDDESEDVISFPNADIKDVSIDRENDQLNVVLNLNESGNFFESGDFLYMINLQTSSYMYTICHGTVIFLMSFGYQGFDFDFTNESLGVIDTVVFTQENPDLDISDNYEIDGNSITFTFDLIDSNEVCVGFGVTIMYSPNFITGGSTAYIDDYNLLEAYDFPIVDAGGKYYAETGEYFDLTGSIESNDTDYRYIWVFGESGQTKIGKTVTHRYLKPETYDEVLYVSDPDTGKYGEAYFEVKVNGTAIEPSNGENGKNNEPGFEIIALISAVAIALILLRKKKK